VRGHGERQIREPIEQCAQPDLALHLRQRRPDAVVDDVWVPETRLTSPDL
jgi:hypothetical protein